MVLVFTLIKSTCLNILLSQEEKQEEPMLRQLALKCKITITVLVVSQMHTSDKKHKVLVLFSVCSNHTPLNHTGQDSKKNN